MPVNMTKEEQWLLQEKYNGVENDAFFADRERLRAGEPLGYVIGWVPFLDCKIYLDSHPLIPRPETEFWVEKAIEQIISSVQGRTLNTVQGPALNTLGEVRILDLCAGSGCIGVAAAKAIPEAQVDFAELEQQHLRTIEKNLNENIPGYSKRSAYYRVVASDLFENVAEQYDFILSNPPYIDPKLDRAEQSVKEHEPHGALYGGTDGMECIERIVEEAPECLKQGGQLWLEHEPEQSAYIHELAEMHQFAATTHKDQFGVERYSILVLK